MTTNVEGKPVLVSECVAISDTMDRLLSPLFGPNALHNLLSTSTGKLMIINNGRSILQSLHLSHPVGRLLVNAAVSLHSLTGDNTKTFIAIVTEVLHQVDSHIGSCHLNDPGKLCERLAIVKALSDIKLKVLPKIQLELVEECAIGTTHRGDRGYSETLDVCSDLIWTSLQGRFNAETRHAFVALSSELLSKCSHCLNDVPSMLQAIIDEFNIICVDSPGQSVLNSRILDGFVIQRGFIPGGSPDLPMDDATFALLNFSLESTCPTESDKRIKLTSPEHAKDSLTWKLIRIKRIISILKSQGINLIVTPEFVSESTILVFAQEKIYIIHSVDKVDVDHVSYFSKTQLICDDSDLISCSNQITGHARRIERVGAGGRSYILIQFPETNMSGAAHHIQHSILLCAPTPGMCDQFASAILCGFRSALLGICPARYIDLGQIRNGDLNTNHKAVETNYGDNMIISEVTVLICPGGGAFESAAYYMLRKHALDISQQVTISLACRILADALLTVPHRLLQNSYRPQAKSTSRVMLHELIRYSDSHTASDSSKLNGDPSSQMQQEARYCRGLDAHSGIGPLSDSRIVEPLGSKMLTVYCVLDVLQQILRIDYLVPMSNLCEPADETRMSDSDD